MEYSIVIPYHSNRTFLELCVKSLLETVPAEVEIILVINTTNKSEHETNFDARVSVYVVNENLGYSKAINFGASKALGNYLIFCDSDTSFTKGWFENLTAFYKSTPNVGIASSKLLNPTTGRVIDFGMALSKYNNAHPFMDQKSDNHIVCTSRKVQMACSANMIISKNLFLDMGMCDEDLINFYQDTDLCLRLKDFGKDCWVVAESIVYHQGSSSQVNRNPYRADIKGYYVAKNLHRMEIDLDSYYAESFSHFRKTHTYAPQYLLIDISTVADKEWYYETVKKEFSVTDTYHFGATVRDLDRINLIAALGYNLLQTRTPIIYFVDRFISVQDNHLWASLRPHSNDLVIDRNANISTIQALNPQAKW
jgi:GT2 family glycosyltransferase